jgi:hypothetical protein
MQMRQQNQITTFNGARELTKHPKLSYSVNIADLSYIYLLRLSFLFSFPLRFSLCVLLFPSHQNIRSCGAWFGRHDLGMVVSQVGEAWFRLVWVWSRDW